jgi:beta-lactamase regulating signal transducer with metallopeptidase domain
MSLPQVFAGWASAQSVQIAFVFVLVFALDALLSRASVRVRSALWAAFCLKLVLPPDSSSPVSVVRILGEGPQEPVIGFAAAASGAAWIPIALFATWAAGFAVSAGVAARRLLRARSRWLTGEHAGEADAAPARIQSLAADLARRVGLRRAPRIVVREDIRSGACIGWFAPRILVPRALIAPEARGSLEHVLLHELGHVRRRDGLRSLFWTLARCIYWFHPLVHVAARRAALLREMSCDDAAARASRDGPLGYRRTLLEQARPLLAPPTGLTSFASGGQIIARIERLSHPLRGRSRHSNVAAAALFVVLCACCIPLGRSAPPPPPAFADVSFDQLDGCLRKRWFVLAEVARHGGAEAVLHTP